MVRDAVWPSARSAGLVGQKLLRVELMELADNDWSLDGHNYQGLRPSGKVVVACDALHAGPGDLVLVAQGSRTRDLTVGRSVPTKTVTLAVLDGGNSTWSAK